MPNPLDAAAVRAWCGLALEALGRERERIDAINVYPVADGDTGTNLYLTLESAARAVEAAFDGHASAGTAPGLADAIGAMAHGALIGARGNSSHVRPAPDSAPARYRGGTRVTQWGGTGMTQWA
ncbi:hypothetical protein AB0H16_20160, partial [Streptomyces lydicus]